MIKTAIRTARSEEGRKLISQARTVATSPESRRLIEQAKRVGKTAGEAVRLPENRTRFDTLRDRLRTPKP
jgi:sensor histidine kinase regulating citrate/malate metabolism